MNPIESITVNITCVNGDLTGTVSVIITGTSLIFTDGIPWVQEGDYVEWSEPVTGGSGTATMKAPSNLITHDGIPIVLTSDYVEVVGTYLSSYSESRVYITTVTVT